VRRFLFPDEGRQRVEMGVIFAGEGLQLSGELVGLRLSDAVIHKEYRIANISLRAVLLRHLLQQTQVLYPLLQVVVVVARQTAAA
jgi:hypothetical protein